ncbi:MAG: FlgD immunoglobulin-like domain containing protein [Candidatus Eisenbacteria bacterium]
MRIYNRALRAVAVHDLLGRHIRTLALGAVPAGTHSLRWDGHSDSGVPAGAGIYFVKLRTPRAEAFARVVRTE